MANKVTRRQEPQEPSIRGTAPRERPKPVATTAPRGPQETASSKPKRDDNS